MIAAASRQAGVTLIEILISLVILTLVAGSVFSAFSGSRSMLASAREIAVATSLATSYLAAAEAIKQKDLEAFPIIEDNIAPPPFRPDRLNLSVTPSPFLRQVSLLRLDQTGKDGGPFFQLRVDISWPGKDGKTLVTYSSFGIISGVSE